MWGHGWDETRWVGRQWVGRAELDEAAGNRPVYLSRIDVHSAVASTALVALAPGARTAQGWSPDGPLTGQAHHDVRRAAKESITPVMRRRAQAGFLRHAAARGLAGVHECAGPDISGVDDLADLLAVRGGPEVVGYWGELGAVDTAVAVGARGVAGDLFVDGALGSRTAALCAPYTDSPSGSGTLYLDAEQVREHVITCTRAGLQAGFHAIGDAAIAVVVAGFERAAEAVGVAALAACRHRLEHLEMIDARQAAALAGLGVIGSVQPVFDAEWGGADGMYARRLGADRGTRLNPFSVLSSAGMGLAFGSDAPVTPVNPWAAVRAAVHHRTDGFGISARAAFTAHTRGGWRAAGVVDRLAGTLVPGASATYAVWRVEELVAGVAGEPVLPVLDEGAAVPECLRTVLCGETIFDREGALR